MISGSVPAIKDGFDSHANLATDIDEGGTVPRSCPAAKSWETIHADPLEGL